MPCPEGLQLNNSHKYSDTATEWQTVSVYIGYNLCDLHLGNNNNNNNNNGLYLYSTL